MKVYQEIASILDAIAHCKASDMNMSVAIDQHEERLKVLLSDHTPSGSGFDNGTTLDRDLSDGQKLVFRTAFHHMDEHGFYDEWTEHVVTVRPSFRGITLSVSGPNKNQIKDYIGETFDFTLNEEPRPQVAV